MKTKKITKTLSLLLLSFSLVVLYSCSSDDDNNPNNNDNDSQAYDVTANLEFSSGEQMDFKANSVLPFADLFIYDENTGHRILTSGYQTTQDGLIYRLDIKGIFKDEPGTYTMYENNDNYLEALGFYLQFTVESEDGAITTDDLYRTKYISAESGNFEITSVSGNRLKGNFSAVLPYVPLEDGNNLKITNGKIDIAISRLSE